MARKRPNTAVGPYAAITRISPEEDVCESGPENMPAVTAWGPEGKTPPSGAPKEESPTQDKVATLRTPRFHLGGVTPAGYTSMYTTVQGMQRVWAELNHSAPYTSSVVDKKGDQAYPTCLLSTKPTGSRVISTPMRRM